MSIWVTDLVVELSIIASKKPWNEVAEGNESTWTRIVVIVALNFQAVINLIATSKEWTEIPISKILGNGGGTGASEEIWSMRL